MNMNYLHAEPEEKLEREKDVTGLGPATRKGLMDTDQKSTLCFKGPRVSSGCALISLK